MKGGVFVSLADSPLLLLKEVKYMNYKKILATISGYSYKDYVVDSATANNTRIGVVRETDGTLVINSQPHKGYDIGYIPEGASVTAYPDQQSGNWYWVSYNGVSGYSYRDYIILQ